jgi:hypothetical protein
MGYLDDKRRNGRLTKQEHDELLALINAALDAANEYTKALLCDGYGNDVEAAANAEDTTYRAVLVWLGAHTKPETPTTSSTASTAGTGSEVAQ